MSKQNNTTTCSKKQDKPIERRTREIHRTGPGVGALLHEIMVKHATVYALVSPSRKQRVRLLTTHGGAVSIRTLKVTK